MELKEVEERRKFYRVAIPNIEFVQLVCEHGNFRVTEISEQGIKFEADKELKVNKWLYGKVEYGENQSMMIYAQILRVAESNIQGQWTTVGKVINLPMSDVVAFQGYLIRTYGTPEEDEGRYLRFKTS